jgi:hypothetical protein
VRNKLGKVIKKSHKWERNSFWINHNASLQALVDQTTHSADQLNGRCTATAMHSLVKLLQHTGAKSLGDLIQPLSWRVLLLRTIVLVQQDGFSAHDISNLIWTYAKAADRITEKVDGRLMDALAKTNIASY